MKTKNLITWLGLAVAVGLLELLAIKKGRPSNINPVSEVHPPETITVLVTNINPLFPHEK